MLLKKIGLISLISSLFSISAFADDKILGSETEIAQYIEKYYLENINLNSDGLDVINNIYVDVGTASEGEMNNAKSHIIKGDTVIVDLRSILDSDERMEKSLFLFGIGIDSPILINGRQQEVTKIFSIEGDAYDEENNF